MGGAGCDTLIGGSGCDDFVFAAGSSWGNDVIADVGCGDEIKLVGYTSGDVCYTVTSQGVKLIFDDGNTLLLNGIDRYELCRVDFDFV